MACCGSPSMGTYSLTLTASDGQVFDLGQQDQPLERVLKRLGVKWFGEAKYGNYAVSTKHASGTDTHGYLLVSPRGMDRRH